MTPFRRKLLAASLLSVSSGVTLPALAQSDSGVTGLEEIIVTARRRDETLQDVPLTVNAVTAEKLDELNVRKLEDLQGIVPGLTLQEDSIAANASVRGVRFDTFASGTNPTVEFYLNDAPISSLSVMQAMFDVSQIEVLRGPQGTLRGRASPSGSITITTQRPVLDELGGYVDLTATNIGGWNTRAALNVPLIEDVLAVRLAGFQEKNDGNRVESAYTGDSSEYDGQGYRFSIGYQPTEALAMNLMYQSVAPDRVTYFPVESATLADPGHQLRNPAGHILLDGDRRKAVADLPEESDSTLERLNFDLSWDVGNHQLNYVYSQSKEDVDRLSPFEIDVTNAVYENFGSPLFPFAQATDWQGLSQHLTTKTDNHSHEIRLQSLEPLFDRVDYVVGYFANENQPDINLTNPTQLAFFTPTGFPAPNNYYGPVAYATSYTPIAIPSKNKETSVFANLTVHLSDATELSAGLRRIDYEEESQLVVDGTELIGPNNVFGPTGNNGLTDWQETIYAVSLKHDFSEDLMAYVSYGTSWRPGAFAEGDFSFLKSALQQSFETLDPEESDSIELGVRSTWLEERLRVNGSIFRQEFDNYPYRSLGSGIYYASYAAQMDSQGNFVGLSPSVAQHNFIAAVPVEVNGIEVEAFFQASENWDLGAQVSYAKGEIDDGLIPCNDYLPNDGVPDTGGMPTLADIAQATGGLFVGDNITGCTVSYRANNSPLITTTLTSQYNFMVGDLDAYVRGLWTFFGKSKNDPSNGIDDVDAYNTLNLYVGLRSAEATWEVMAYGKNVFDSQEVIMRNATPGSISYIGLDATSFTPVDSLGGAVLSDYREIGLTPPREFGVNFRYNF